MPKIYSDLEKIKWLELYEKGKTASWIARHAKSDLRTIRKGIEDARRRKDAKIARTELLKDALRKHQDSLLEELDRIRSGLKLPAEDWAALSWYHNGDSIFSPPEEVKESQAESVLQSHGVKSRKEESALLKLLKQHLRNDKLWKVISKWQKACVAHLIARIALQYRTVALLEEKTGYKLIDSADSPKPFLYSFTTGDLFYRAVLRHAFDTVKGNIEFENQLNINTTSGDVRYHGTVLAEAPGDEEKVRRRMLVAFKELKQSPEVIPVIDAYRTLQEATISARQVIEQIQLVGFINGQCDICRRLGM